MPNPTPPPSLTIGLGFDGELRILYPNGKSCDLPKGEAEARIREVLEGFRRDLQAIRREVSEATYSELPPVKRVGRPVKLARPLTLADLGFT